MKNHDQFYSFARVYDVAFDFKNIPAECEFLRSVFRRIHSHDPNSFLDIAAGPALHAIEMAKMNLRAGAIDLSEEMVTYGREKSKNAGAVVDYRQDDMINFTVDQKFDLAGIFMDSTSYLLDNESVKRHLSSVANALNPKGVYILEMSHPRDVFSVGLSTTSSWEIEKDGVWVSVAWADPTDLFDPVSQVTQTTVKMRFKVDGAERELVETAPQRCFTANEFLALVDAEGSFEVATIYGAMSESITFSNDKKAWRMVPVLRKR